MNSTSEGGPGEDEERLQTYPSPTPESREPPPYYGHDPDHEHDVPPQEPQQQDSSATPHQSSHAASVEELQLAAQLGQDLAAEPMLPVTDPNMKFDEPPLRNIMPHPDDHQLRLPQTEDSGLRNVMPHSDDVQSRSFIPEESVPAHSMQHASQGQVPVIQNLPHSFSATVDDATPPRKRSKVSRACDECRRKKVRCDAQSDIGDMPCTNCKRSSQRCSFSRIPQKRGPSKGYIKELADRINSIEGRLGENAGGDETSRKRTFSNVSGADIPSQATSRPGNSTWHVEGRALPGLTPERAQSTYSLNGLAPQPIALKPELPIKSTVAGMDAPIGDIPGISQPREVNEDVFQCYLTTIHPHLPILQEDKSRLEASLTQCSGLLREAFLETFSGTMRSFPTCEAMTTGDVGLAMKMLAEWEANDDERRTASSSLVHLQTLLLLLIEVESRPSTCLGPSKDSLLGRALGASWAMRLYNATINDSAHGPSEVTIESDDHMRHRLWWSLVVLDRWNAVATGTATMIRNESTVVPAGLERVVGEKAFLMIRCSKVLSRISTVLSGLQVKLDGSTFPNKLAGDLLNDYVENFREDLPVHADDATFQLIHMAYWYARLLAYLLHPSAKAEDVFWPCRQVIGLLRAMPQVMSPWNHHIIGLVMLCLVELSKVEGAADEANKLLAELKSASANSTPWSVVVGEQISDHLRLSTTSQGLLLQLADVAASSSAATGTNEAEGLFSSCRTAERYEDLGFDPRLFLMGGYLKAIWTSHLQA